VRTRNPITYPSTISSASVGWHRSFTRTSILWSLPANQQFIVGLISGRRPTKLRWCMSLRHPVFTTLMLRCGNHSQAPSLQVSCRKQPLCSGLLRKRSPTMWNNGTLHNIPLCRAFLDLRPLATLLLVLVIPTPTGWRRLTGSPRLQIILHKRGTKYSSLLRKMTLQDEGSYESSPPCTLL